jgi:hypothetical protein
MMNVQECSPVPVAREQVPLEPDSRGEPLVRPLPGKGEAADKIAAVTQKPPRTRPGRFPLSKTDPTK